MSHTSVGGYHRHVKGFKVCLFQGNWHVNRKEFIKQCTGILIHSHIHFIDRNEAIPLVSHSDMQVHETVFCEIRFNY